MQIGKACCLSFRRYTDIFLELLSTSINYTRDQLHHFCLKSNEFSQINFRYRQEKHTVFPCGSILLFLENKFLAGLRPGAMLKELSHVRTEICFHRRGKSKSTLSYMNPLQNYLDRFRTVELCLITFVTRDHR